MILKFSAKPECNPCFPGKPNMRSHEVQLSLVKKSAGFIMHGPDALNMSYGQIYIILTKKVDLLSKVKENEWNLKEQWKLF